ncbi:SAP-like protein BP-73 [Acorus gramineus]|uniref:SAP-like protein BP-73 n=1 Tax=Acorus gramineus TaxID=55184 RepID=A0AAV9A124_ACOGR|nr:SAP-like protein BP-73 [Acorus gramineus]
MPPITKSISQVCWKKYAIPPPPQIPLPRPQLQTLPQISLLNLTEIADDAQHFSYWRDLPQLSVSCIRSEGSGRGRRRRNTTSDGSTENQDELKATQSSDGEDSKSSSQEEIIALFRRIQSSISKEGSVRTKYRRPIKTKERQSSESVLEVLRQYPPKKQERGSTKEVDEVQVLSGGSQRGEKTEDNVQSTDFKPSRPASNFVKKSPIPSPSTPKEEIVMISGGGLTAVVTEEALERPRLDALKLPELKELARSKGLKGYSKMKKGELVELLKGVE